MNNDIRPPQRQIEPPQRPVEHAAPAPEPGPHEVSPAPGELPPVIPASVSDSTEAVPSLPVSDVKKKRSWLAWAGIALLICIGIGLVAGYGWYRHALSPMTTKEQAESRQIKIAPGTTPQQIASTLKQEQLIRSELAFMVYIRVHNQRGQLQAGSYIISTHESMKQIVDHLVSGRVEEYEITFYPGAALSSSAATDPTPTHRKVLQKVGFTDEEIERAFTASYDHPLLADKPANADLEGYIYGDTYRIAAGSSVEEVLEVTFDEFYAKLQAENVLPLLSERNLSLHQAITLGSIVQKESGGDDKSQIAQVFYSRLAKGMNLGSDVTYQYIADKTGVARDVNLDSPYNTRRYGGLPPGPIASPSIDAMRAVASPASGDYLFFLSGDDDVTYFARTEAEHENNIKQHCQQKCQIL